MPIMMSDLKRYKSPYAATHTVRRLALYLAVMMMMMMTIKSASRNGQGAL